MSRKLNDFGAGAGKSGVFQSYAIFSVVAFRAVNDDADRAVNDPSGKPSADRPADGNTNAASSVHRTVGDNLYTNAAHAGRLRPGKVLHNLEAHPGESGKQETALSLWKVEHGLRARCE